MNKRTLYQSFLGSQRTSVISHRGNSLKDSHENVPSHSQPGIRAEFPLKRVANNRDNSRGDGRESEGDEIEDRIILKHVTTERD